MVSATLDKVSGWLNYKMEDVGSDDWVSVIVFVHHWRFGTRKKLLRAGLFMQKRSWSARIAYGIIQKRNISRLEELDVVQKIDTPREVSF